MNASNNELYYDPYDFGIDANPYPVWKRMRDEAPLYRNEEHNFWALSRFEDVVQASKQHDVFSSARGTVLDLIDQIRDPRPMIFQDRPEHSYLRSLVSRAFTPRRIADLEPMIREIVVEALEPLEDREEFDYLADFGANVPMLVISAMLGVPEEDRENIRDWNDQLLSRKEGVTEVDKEWHDDLLRKIYGSFAKYVGERRENPCDDMMSDLIAAETTLEDGSKRQLNDMEILSFIGLLSGAGNETVARLLGSVGAVLAEFPQQRQLLVEQPGLIPNAVEELLRFEAPSPVQARTLTEDIERYGQTIKAGEVVLLLTGSAGRDEREYENPDDFDVQRSFDRHLSLGQGIHFCLGAALARLEGKVALEETLKRFPSWEVNWDKVERVHTSTVRGYAKMPIRIS